MNPTLKKIDVHFPEASGEIKPAQWEVRILLRETTGRTGKKTGSARQLMLRPFYHRFRRKLTELVSTEYP